MLGAIGLDGFIAAMSVEAATDSAIFAAYLEQVLLPALRWRKPDAVLIMDNLRPQDATGAIGARWRWCMDAPRIVIWADGDAGSCTVAFADVPAGGYGS